MKTYLVVDSDMEPVIGTDDLSTAEKEARKESGVGYPSHLYVLKETYETVTKTTVSVIKQRDL